MYCRAFEEIRRILAGRSFVNPVERAGFAGRCIANGGQVSMTKAFAAAEQRRQ